MYKPLSVTVLGALTLAVSSVAFAQSGTMPPPSSMAQPQAPQPKMSTTSTQSTTTSFLKSADEGGQAEIALATTALSKTSNDQVKVLAQTIQHDHQAANAELETLAQQKKIMLPTSVSKTHQALADRLGKMSGPGFDKAYVNEMVKDHKTDIAEFEKHEKDSDPDVAAWVTKTLPALRNHLKLAEDAQKAMGGA
jgi:putative membrane protein